MQLLPAEVPLAMALPRLHLALAVLLLALASSGRLHAQTSADSPADGYTRSDRLGITFISSVDTPLSEDRYAQALALGAGWNRWPLYWDRVETDAGRFAWDAYDRLVEADLAHGLQTNVILLGIPAFYRDESSIKDLYEPIFVDGSDTPREGKAVNPDNPWATFVRAAVSRFRPGGELAAERDWPADRGIRLWEIWNEPDFAAFWTGGVRDYTRLLQVAYLVIHLADPAATVMLGGLLYPGQSNWLAQVLGRIINDPFREDHNWYMDAVAVHSYGNAWRSGWLTLYVRQTLTEFRLERPIWLNESGVAAWDDYPGPTWLADDPGARSTLATQRQQADFLVQSSAYAWAEGAHTIFYHQLYDDCGDRPPGTDFAPDDRGAFGEAFGIFRNPRGSVCFSQHPDANTARPVADAYRLLARVFGAVPFSRRGLVEEREDGAVLITFTRPLSEERIVVAWNTSPEPLDLALPALSTSATLYTLDGEEPLPARGETYALSLPPSLAPARHSSAAGGAADIGGAPLILVEPLGEAARDLLARTFADSAPVTPTPPPAVVALSADAIAELVDESPTGAAFTSLNVSRLRSGPTTEAAVLGTIPPRESASVVGRNSDATWLQLDYDGRRVWVAAFLGDLHGDLARVPVVRGQATAGETAAPEPSAGGA